LEKHGVDLLEIDGLGLIAHGFDECADAEVSNGPQRAFRTACYEVVQGLEPRRRRQAEA
jgi:hypothetical protein